MIINGDTIVAITVEQSLKVNKAFIKKNYYKIVNDSLGTKIVLLETKVENDSIIIGDQKFQIDKLKEIVTNNAVVTNKLKEDLKATDKQLRREKRKRTLDKTLLGISIGVNAALLILFLVK